MKFLLLALKTIDHNKEFIVLVCILLAILSLVFIVAKAYIEFVRKQEKCDGRFNLQDFKIEAVEKDVKESKEYSKEALDVSNKALSCATKMGERVTEMGENFEAFLSGKFDGVEHEKRNIRS